jgi:hypothetical protein
MGELNESNEWFEQAAKEVSETRAAEERRHAEEQAALRKAAKDRLDAERARLNRKDRQEVAAEKRAYQEVAAGLRAAVDPSSSLYGGGSSRPIAPGYASGGYIPPPENPRAPRPGSPEVHRLSADSAWHLILATVRNSPDPIEAVSLWLTKATNDLTDIAREAREAEDQK